MAEVNRMDNRSWIRQALAHKDGPVPYNLLVSPPAKAALDAHYGSPFEDAIGMPIRMSGTSSIKPLYADPDKYGPTIRDEFGVTWSTNKIDRGSPIGPPLHEPNLDGFTWPDPTAGYRFDHLPAWTAQNQGHYLVLWVGDLWERATFMRGMEELLLDVFLHPQFVEELLEGLTEHILRTMQCILDRGLAFDCIAVSDDYGTQHGMLISPEHWRRLIRPRLARIYGLAKAHGKDVFHHTCGHVTPIIGDLIDIGLDILHPIQPEAMDVAELKRQFGRRLTFCGGLPTQGLLPCGTPQQVRDEVKRLKDVLGAGGGYILEPGITIQADVPVANMVAMIDEARRL